MTNLPCRVDFDLNKYLDEQEEAMELDDYLAEKRQEDEAMFAKEFEDKLWAGDMDLARELLQDVLQDEKKSTVLEGHLLLALHLAVRSSGREGGGQLQSIASYLAGIYAENEAGKRYENGFWISDCEE